MKTINDHTVELTPLEQQASDLFETLLDCDESILSAVDQISDRFGATLDLAFYAWLLGGGCNRRYFVVDGELFYDCDLANCPCNEVDPS